MAIQRQQKMDDYEAFVEKFKPKKTTDDCYTPPHVYAEKLELARKIHKERQVARGEKEPPHVWTLSPRELEIVRALNQKEIQADA